MAEKDKDLERLQRAVAERGIEGLTPVEQRLFQQRYGKAYALISMDPELLRIALRGIRQGWKEEDFTRAYQNSKWFTDRNAKQRIVATFETSDPAEFRSVLDEVKEALRLSSIRASGTAASDADLEEDARELMTKYYDGNLNSVLLQVDKFANRAYVGNGAVRFGGEAATRDMEIRNYARQMGYDVESEVGTYVDQIFAGEDTLENVQAKIRDEAIKYYPQFADRIKAGATVEEIAFPYRRMLGDMLELDQEQVDIIGDKGSIDPLMARAMFATDDKGNPKTMGLWEFRKAIKQDERWQFTQNAQSEYASMARDLMRMFGAGV